MHHFGGVGSRSIRVADRFPLSKHSSNRYLVDARGEPFLIWGDTPWSIAVQCTREQIDSYIAKRWAQGFNAILFNAIEHQFSDNSPAYRNAYGADPFTSMTDFASPNATYWAVVDYVVNACLARGIACLINPAYWGYQGGSEGWWTEINAETNADLQTYGAWLANRYTQPNVLLCFGGDWGGTNSTNRDKQWNIVTGIRTVRTSDLITCHNDRGDSDAYSTWNGYTGFNLNNVYISSDGSDGYSESATAYGRTGYPFFMIEAGYEGEAAGTAYFIAQIQCVLSGACGAFYGHGEVWNFDYNGTVGGPAGVISSYLETTGATRIGYLGALLASVPWWKLVPKTDTSLVTSSLGTGTSRICPAIDAKGSFALIWIPGTPTVTVNLAAFTKPSLRARWWEPTTGGFTSIGTYTNSGTQNFTPSTSDKVLVID